MKTTFCLPSRRWWCLHEEEHAVKAFGHEAFDIFEKNHGLLRPVIRAGEIGAAI